MDGDGSFQKMLASLRTSFTTRLPAGLTPSSDARLARTLGHYIREVVRVHGTFDEQEILRETFDSMAGWFRRNTSQLSPLFRHETPVEAAVAPDLVPGGGAFAGEFKMNPSSLGSHEFKEFQYIPEHGPRPPVQQKDVIQKQEDVVKYRDTEHNLILNSKDRDWLHSSAKQNRYNFSVHLDTWRQQGKSPQLALMVRLRNIVRIEFIKVILPVESLRLVVPRTCIPPALVPEQTFYSVLALPFINVILDEYQGNNVGTNDTIDRSLAVCQYDATWRTDGYHSRTNTNRGFSLFFPKFMKAQRIYAPTPLANFQKLTFSILDSENQPLSTLPDSSCIEDIRFGYDISGSCYYDSSGSYIFIRTKEPFTLWAYSQLDKLLFDGLQFTDASSATVDIAGKTFIEWLQDPNGHIVVGIGYGTDTCCVCTEPSPELVYLADGADPVSGYANWIIIRNRFNDPFGRNYFLGTTAIDEKALTDKLCNLQTGGVLNLSRQVQLSLRVITRDYDSATTVRPDNV